MIRREMLAALIVMLLPAAAIGQTGDSTIAGLVKDGSGAAVPGVAVLLTNEATGVTVETVTNTEGLYRVPALVPGRYRVEAKLEGFDPFKPDVGHRCYRSHSWSDSGRREGWGPTGFGSLRDRSGSGGGGVLAATRS